MRFFLFLLLCCVLRVHAAPYEFYDQSCFKRKSNQKFTLVKNGKATCPIIVSESVSPRTMDAVKDLQYYLKKMSGANFEIQIGFKGKIPEKAIWIGHHDVLPNLFGKTIFELKLEEILIVSNSKHLAILGDDGADGLVKDIYINQVHFPNAQASYGTINAIYTFLQDFLGVRWFYPGEFGEDYIFSKNIEIDQVEFMYAPQFTWRSGLINAHRPGVRTSLRTENIWSIRQRLFYSSTVIHAGHAFVQWWSRYHSTFPDVFALNNQGNRKPLSNPRQVKLCLTNPNTKNLWLNEVSEHLANNPFSNFIPANENDNHGTGHCECESCMALDVISVKEKEKHLSDRHLWFANTLYSGLINRYQEHKHKYVIFFAYANNRQTPKKIKVEGNVAVVAVHNFHMRRSNNLDLNDPMISGYLNWSKLTDQIFWRPNLNDPVGLSWGVYDIAFTQSIENFKFVAENNCKGVFFDAYRDHWSTQGIQYYIESRLAWNPYLDKDVLMTDYYERMYGPAQDEMRAFWTLVENTRNALHEEYGELVARFVIYRGFDNDWFEQAHQLLSLAERKLQGEDDKYIKRLDFIKFGFNYTKEIVELRRLMHQYEDGDQSKFKEINIVTNRISNMRQTMPDFAINFSSLVFDQEAHIPGSRARRMGGLMINGDVRGVSKRRIPKFQE